MHDYWVIVKGYGKTTVKITASGTGVYQSAVKKIAITVVPQKAVISSLSSRKRGRIACKVKGQKGVEGYEFMITAPSGIKKIIKSKHPRFKIMYVSGVKY